MSVMSTFVDQEYISQRGDTHEIPMVGNYVLGLTSGMEIVTVSFVVCLRGVVDDWRKRGRRNI